MPCRPNRVAFFKIIIIYFLSTLICSLSTGVWETLRNGNGGFNNKRHVVRFLREMISTPAGGGGVSQDTTRGQRSHAA